MTRTKRERLRDTYAALARSQHSVILCFATQWLYLPDQAPTAVPAPKLQPKALAFRPHRVELRDDDVDGVTG